MFIFCLVLLIFSIEVAVNGTVFTPDTELIYTTGELVEIEAELINNAGKILSKEPLKRAS